MANLMNNYARLPIAFERGQGVWLWDESGKRYLDALAGVAVCALGHAHPRLVKAVADQAATLIHTSNVYRIKRQEELAEKLCALSGMEEAFFCNSGAEANEAAIKLARLVGHRKEIEVPTVIVMEHSFHGRTMATLTATGSRKVQAGFEPLLAGFARVPYGDAASVEQVAAHNKNVVAVLVEPIQGEGGVRVPAADYLPRLRAICDTNGWLLMLDEVQTGVGRTGKWFGFQHTGIRPDVMTLAKGLGGGLPIGTCLAAGPAAGTFKPGSHGSTFGGNPLVCAAALATLETIETDGLLANATKMGELIRTGVAERLAGTEGVKDIHGKGLMIGIELDRPCGELVKLALARGLLINVTADTVIRLVPPLVISETEVLQLLEGLVPLVADFLSAPAAVAAAQ